MVHIQTFSESGGHAQNEDAFAVLNHPLDTDVRLCFVADGQGGRAGGGSAARLACQTALDAAVALAPAQLTHPTAWAEVLRLADEAVWTDPMAGFTTLVALGVGRNWVVGVSNGDSAAMLVSAESSVELTARQHKNPPIGSRMATAVPFTATLAEGWQLLAMSDGVWKYVGWDRVIQAARRERGARLIAALEQLARLPGSGRFQDDFTVVVLEGSAIDGLASGAA